MKCPNCGRTNENNTKFCKTCGINLEENVNKETNKINNTTIENKTENKLNITEIENKTKSSLYSWRLCCSGCIIVVSIIIIISTML